MAVAPDTRDFTSGIGALTLWENKRQEQERQGRRSSLAITSSFVISKLCQLSNGHLGSFIAYVVVTRIYTSSTCRMERVFAGQFWP